MKKKTSTQSTAHAQALAKIKRLEEYLKTNPNNILTANRLAELKKMHGDKKV